MFKVLFYILVFVDVARADYGLRRHSDIKYDSGYSLRDDSVIKLTNMPKVRSQDTFGICYAFVASTLVDEANCVAHKKENCADVASDEKASPLDITRYSRAPDDSLDSSDRESFSGLHEGGSAAYTLQNIVKAKYIIQESCAPVDQIVAKATTPQQAQELEIAMWKTLRDSYESYQKKTKECVDCGLEYATGKSNDIKENFNLKVSNQEILEAFSQESYAKFLDKLLIPESCRSIDNWTVLKGRWSMKAYPAKGEKADYSSMISRIREVLQQKRPVSLSFCAQEPLLVKSQKACGESKDPSGNVSGAGHAVVVKGYREICNSKNVCRHEVQVQNSWGEGWQKSNDDGWVDAKEILDRTFYEDYSLSWLQPRS